jgi:hypothetical protein
MFNLIVSGRVGDDRRGLISAERVFGYTSDEVNCQFVKDGKIDFQSVIKFPTLLMEEGRGEEVARIAWLSRVTRKGSDYQIEYAIDPDLPKFTNAEIEELQSDLDMHDWELGTNHWAIKDVDLFEILFRKLTRRRVAPTVFQLSNKPVNSRLISFMMPFSSPFTTVYEDVKAVLEANGYHCQRADDMWIHAQIMTDIIELICTSAVVVCDLSQKNPNVFYEVGIAHTLAKEVVLITQSQDDVPFDLKAIRHLSYLNNGEGRAKLAKQVLFRIQAVT